MKSPFALLLLFALAPASFAADKTEQRPVVWGAMTQNKGCVIFEESHKTSGMFWGVAVTTKTIGKLTVIESQNYNLGQDVILETPENMDDLMERAQTDLIKFVKIPKKYTPELLERARAACK